MCYQPVFVDNRQNSYCSYISARSCRTDRVIRAKDRIRRARVFCALFRIRTRFFARSREYYKSVINLTRKSRCLNYISGIGDFASIDQCSSLSPRVDECDKRLCFFFLFFFHHRRGHRRRAMEKMLLRGIAFAEARRNSARRVFKSRDKTQGNGCERDAADLCHDGSLARHVGRTMAHRPPEEPLSPIFPTPFVSCEKEFERIAERT